jgi:hypothetical protein
MLGNYNEETSSTGNKHVDQAVDPTVARGTPLTIEQEKKHAIEVCGVRVQVHAQT